MLLVAFSTLFESPWNLVTLGDVLRVYRNEVLGDSSYNTDWARSCTGEGVEDVVLSGVLSVEDLVFLFFNF